MKMFALVHKIFAYCNIWQVGGKDQLGNIVAGQEMISKEGDKEGQSLTVNTYLPYYTTLITRCGA